ncbi:type II secretion system protein J [Chamaesiphon sp. GL140_3_metabinner_50]|uniref:PulJ/GspJ family protein n=1 Tax=Chamaesiphon sp. GL140_3_metabinner_50 TaxID=2970812 RepID=UPI0025DB1C85|nr:prepilin-type N-terminal cleavage/methylation domain-containing protein [Chamaesiphon sp. GL140_3_metabinner_50]
MKFIFRYIRSISYRDRLQNEAGFTLAELLVALAITGIVIGLTGSGLYALMKADRRSQIETTDRLELERALAFMTDEIKMSQQITIDTESVLTSTMNFMPVPGNISIQPILVLSPAPSSGLTKPIVYYVAELPNSSVWLGPRVIYRWGPTLLQNGNYSDGSGREANRIPRPLRVQYYNEVLVDGISAVATAEAAIACESSYGNAAPVVADRLGFYACIAPDKKSVKLWMSRQPNPSATARSISALVVTRSN